MPHPRHPPTAGHQRCTGYTPDFGWIDLPVLDERGQPRHRRGAAIDAPGLYFAGLRFQYRLNSSLVGGVGQDATHIAEQVSRRTLAAAA